MVNAIFTYRKTGGVNITKKYGHLPSLQIYCSVLVSVSVFCNICTGCKFVKIQFFVQCTSITSLLLAVRTSTVTTVSKKVTMITSSYYLLSSPLRWKALYFRLSRINILDLNILHLQIIFACLPPVKPRDIAFISSILMGVQRWRVSWIKSTCCQYSLGWVGWGWWAAMMGVGPFAKKKKNLRGVGWDPGFPVARKARNCNASDKPRHHVPSIPPLFSYI